MKKPSKIPGLNETVLACSDCNMVGAIAVRYDRVLACGMPGAVIVELSEPGTVVLTFKCETCQGHGTVIRGTNGLLM